MQDRQPEHGAPSGQRQTRMFYEPTGAGETDWPRVSAAGHYDPVSETAETITLWRPTGPHELALVEAPGWREWSPRLSSQPMGGRT
jgi:hypothetical protein